MSKVAVVGLKKVCRRNGIPVPYRGYWARVAVGQRLPRPPLPALEKGQRDLIVINPPVPKAPPPPPPPIPPAVQAVMDEESRPENRVTVAKTLANPHRTIGGWLEDDRRTRILHRHDRWYHESNKPLDRDPLARRRLLILSTLFKALDQRGYKLVVKRSYGHEVQIERDSECLVIEVRERTQRIRRPLTKKVHRERGHLSTGKNWTQERHATGELVLGIRELETRRCCEEWRESADRRLEGQLNEVLVGIARQFETQRAHREFWEAERKREGEAAQRRYELEQQQKRERLRFRRLVQHAEDRRTATEIRALVEAVRAKRAGASRGRSEVRALEQLGAGAR